MQFEITYQRFRPYVDNKKCQEIRNKEIVGGKNGRVIEYEHVTDKGQLFYTKNKIPLETKLVFVPGVSKSIPYQAKCKHNKVVVYPKNRYSAQEMIDIFSNTSK